jgi:hypothetical protein
MPDLPWGPFFCDVGSQRQEELPDPGIESVTEPLKKKGRGRRPHCMVIMLVGTRFAARTSSLVLVVVEISSVAQHNTTQHSNPSHGEGKTLCQRVQTFQLSKLVQCVCTSCTIQSFIAPGLMSSVSA